MSFVIDQINIILIAIWKVQMSTRMSVYKVWEEMHDPTIVGAHALAMFLVIPLSMKRRGPLSKIVRTEWFIIRFVFKDWKSISKFTAFIMEIWRELLVYTTYYIVLTIKYIIQKEYIIWNIKCERLVLLRWCRGNWHWSLSLFMTSCATFMS